MKLWLDDIRVPPDVGNGALMFFRHERELHRHSKWLWVKSYDEAVIALSLFDFDVISLDHDLGEYKTGYDVVCWIEEQVACNRNFNFADIRVHSANPVGKKRMLQGIDSIYKMMEDNVLVQGR